MRNKIEHSRRNRQTHFECSRCDRSVYRSNEKSRWSKLSCDGHKKLNDSTTHDALLFSWRIQRGIIIESSAKTRPSHAAVKRKMRNSRDVIVRCQINQPISESTKIAFDSYLSFCQNKGFYVRLHRPSRPKSRLPRRGSARRRPRAAIATYCEMRIRQGS